MFYDPFSVDFCVWYEVMLAIYFFFLPHQNSVVPAPFLEQTVLFPLNWQLYKKPTDPVFLSYFIPEISVFILMT